MKKLICLITIILLSSPILFAQTKAGKTDTTKHTEYYSCPMHPDFVSNSPGKCPKCNMDLELSTKEKMKTAVTKNYSCPVHSDVYKHDPGKCPKCGRKLNLSPKEQMKAATVKLYTCPMHPEIALDKEGNCPKCGKTLIEKKTNE